MYLASPPASGAEGIRHRFGQGTMALSSQLASCCSSSSPAVSWLFLHWTFSRLIAWFAASYSNILVILKIKTFVCMMLLILYRLGFWQRFDHLTASLPLSMCVCVYIVCPLCLTMYTCKYAERYTRDKLNSLFIVTKILILHAGGQSFFRFQASRECWKATLEPRNRWDPTL